MELFEQGSIGDRPGASGAFTVDETLEIGEKIADAAAAAYWAGVSHRDIKPQNILLSEYGPACGDFGIARTSANLEWSQSLDQLTPRHAAPETPSSAARPPPSPTCTPWGRPSTPCWPDDLPSPGRPGRRRCGTKPG